MFFIDLDLLNFLCNKEIFSKMSSIDQLFKNVMQVKPDIRSKITIVGSGKVGTATAFAILLQDICDEVAIISRNEDIANGETLDLQHGSYYLKNKKISGGSDLSLSSKSNLIIFTAGARKKEGESQLDLAQKNVEILKVLIPRLVHYSPDAVLLVVTTPCDILAYVAWKMSGLPKNRVIASGTCLDSARLRNLLAQKFNVSSSVVDGWIIGEHGESSIPHWSTVSIAGVKLRELNLSAGLENDAEKWQGVHQEVVKADFEVFQLKGCTSWGIGLTLADLASSILKSTGDVKAVSTMVKGLYGITKEVFLSLPCKLNSTGITSIVNIKLTDEERKQLLSSANVIDEIQKGISF